jgi:Phage tail assembly chaperone protein
MDYLLASNGTISKFPYSLEELRSDNPQTSFSVEMSAGELASWGVYSVEKQNPPAYNEKTEAIELQLPSLLTGGWVMEWLIISVDPAELERRTTAQAALQREERNRVLSRTDYTQCLDFPGTDNERAAYAVFRQALRDVPEQVGFPWDVVWPLPFSEA